MKHKIKLLEEMAQQEHVFIMSFTESQLRSEILSAEIAIRNFHVFRADRDDSTRGGGVVMYIHENIATSCNVLATVSIGLVEYLIVYVSLLNMLIVSVYRSPYASAQDFLTALEHIQAKIDEMGAPTPTIILNGDFNFPIIDWPSGSVYGGSESKRTQAQALLRFANSNVLEQCVLRPTRENNILDLLFTNNDQFVHSYRIDDTIVSDHRFITVQTSIDFCNPVKDVGPTGDFASLIFF